VPVPVPAVEYARTDDGVHVAFCTLGADPDCADPRDVLLVTGGFIPLEVAAEDAGFDRLLSGLRGLGRVIVFDRRGIGLSDPIADWERPVLDQWADDAAAVVTAAGARDVVVVSIEAYGVGSRFVARNPDTVDRFVLYDPIVTGDDRWPEFAEQRRKRVQANIEGNADMLEIMAPSRASDPSFREWYLRAGRVGASPATAQRVWQSVWSSPPSEALLDRITVPTLLLHRRENAIVPDDAIAHATSLLADVTVVEVEGQDAFAFSGDVDALVAEIAEFVVGERRVPPPERLLAAVMFTDIVSSTQRAVALGDAAWKQLLDRHDRTVRAAVGRCGGTVVKTTGDGVLAVFPSASGALHAARRLRADLSPDEISVRVGVHVGEIDRRGDDISGLAVNVAARVMALAPDDEIAVTQSVVASTVGQSAEFASLGVHELKGVPGSWELFRAP
jgi:class 3 adenylate cyclase/alpha-beta hydrolase superfamily lysophospholipase